jgi:Flp pilus assembly protein TadG
VAPFLLILLTGLFTFGIAYINDMTLINAVGAGGQQLQTIRTTTTDPCKDTFTAITNAAPGLNPAKITMTLTMNGNSPITNTGTANTCSGDQTELVANGSFTIKAQYPCALAVYGKAVSSNCAISTTLTEFSY